MKWEKTEKKDSVLESYFKGSTINVIGKIKSIAFAFNPEGARKELEDELGALPDALFDAAIMEELEDSAQELTRAAKSLDTNELASFNANVEPFDALAKAIRVYAEKHKSSVGLETLEE